MNGMFLAILAQSMLLFGPHAGFNQPGGSAVSSEYMERVSTEIVQKNISLKPGGLILLDTEIGNISVEEFDGRDVKIELTLRGTPDGISHFHFTHNFFGNQLTLKGWYEKGEPAGGRALNQVDFVVRIPKASHYSLRAVTKQGSIHAAVSGNMKEVELFTEAGSVKLDLPSNLSANIDASTSDLGKVMINPTSVFSVICPNCEIRQDDHLKARMNGGGPSITAYSGIGNVRVEITSKEGGSRS
jgi:hypothetical protein